MGRRIPWEGIIVEVPDNASDEHVAAILQAVSAQSVKPENAPVVGGVPGGTVEEPPPPESLSETIMRAPAAIPGVLDMSGRGIAEGVLTIAGMPMDLVNIAPMALNALPGVDNVGPLAPNVSDPEKTGAWGIVGGSQSLMKSVDWANEQTARLLGVEPPNPEPENLAERMVHRVGQEVGAAAPFALGALARAKRLGDIRVGELAPRAKQPINPINVFRKELQAGGGGLEAAAGTAGQVGKEALARLFAPVKNVTDTMTKSAAADPTRFLKKEAYAALTAGEGASLANEYSRATGVDPDSNTAKAQDLVGAITGVGVGAFGKSTLGGLANLFRAATQRPTYVDDLVKQEAADRIINAAGIQKDISTPPDTRELVDAIIRSPPIANAIPGVVESLADRTKNVGIANLEYSRQSGQNRGMYAQKVEQNQAAVNAAIEGHKPTAPAAALSEQLLAERSRQLGELTQAEQEAARAAGASERALDPRMIAEERGADIRGALETSRDASADEVRKAWEPINQSLEQVDLTPLADTFKQATDELSKAEQRRFMPSEAGIPEELSRVEPPQPIGLLDAQGNPIVRQPAAELQNIKEVTGLRSALTTAIAEAMDKPGGANEARILRGYVEQIDNFLDTNVPTALRNQYDTAKQLRVRHGDRFEQPQTAVAQTLAEKRGQPAMHPSVVPRKFVQPENGRVSDFRHLMQEAGTDQRAINAVRDHLRQVIKDRGLLKHPEEIDSFLQQYDTVLQRFPEIRTELTGAGQQRVAATQAETVRNVFQERHGTTPTPTTPGTPGTSVAGKYMAFGTDQAKRAMRQVISAKGSGAAADELLAFVDNNPQAVEGARKAFWEVLEEQGRSKGGTTGLVETGEQPWLKGKLREFMKDPDNRAVMQRLWRDKPEELEGIQKIVDAMQGLDTRVGQRAPGTSGTAQSVLPSAEKLSSLALAQKRGQVGLTWIGITLGNMVGRKLVKRAQADAIERMTDDALLHPDKAALLLAENNPANRAALARWAKGYLGNETSTIINMLSADEKASDDEEAINRKQPAGAR